MGTVLENENWKIKVYAPPREHGAPHVHIIDKGSNAELKVYLGTLTVVGKTKFSKKSVKKILRYIYNNYDYLMDKWEQYHEKK